MNNIIVDLEATCWEDHRNFANEIIEIGAVSLSDNGETNSTFQRYVAPVINKELSNFCKNLTHISQENINAAPCFLVALQAFQDWIDLESPYKIWSWGLYDKKQFVEECNRFHLFSDWIQESHYNLKNEFSKVRRIKKRVGAKKAINILHLDYEGTHHRAIWDAINIGRIFNADREWYIENAVPTPSVENFWPNFPKTYRLND